ncbi:SigE family RNA polymerase sigma factor [Catellatospora chokoriensis]|uniref:RNA polymerase sigma24 factor n=1 Tax=Catellatospora chokoriensis TaxID=310353 RepID=A0A8J3NS04_9ACTN|nr:SigE family RNA polymerase sigma factor [Catellatospora chokoriensis]GIF90026.1 RNA polymerase sigma24 factor [Catellatospora chokoriensis]
MDEDATAVFTEFAMARTPALIRVAYLLTGDQHAAEDLVQSALAKTYARWGSLRHRDPEGYVRTVMYREQVSWWRRLGRSRESVLPTPADLTVPDPSTHTDLRVTMRAALRLLSPAQRTVVVLRYYEDLTETQVADILGCSVGTVRSRTSRAVSRLREVLPATALVLETTP